MLTYQNPVYRRDCADPFALAYDGTFWVYRTGHWKDGRIFGILRSSDLIHWDEVGGAMDPLPAGNPEYWAPEVTYLNGTFYLYYSTGNEVNMQLRVATSGRPEGPFIDSGRVLTHEQFAIDAHVFVDDNGSRYMFYATDFLERDRVGTSTVMDRMIDPFTLEGKPTPVSLAKYDWQIFDPRRASKNNARWHTIEGSFVLKHKGLYYQMFSGGNYQNKSYGVGYAVTGSLSDRQEWNQTIDGETVFPILRTIPDQVIGPGHNSVVSGPDQRQLFCVYHVIMPQASLVRILAVDRLEWVGDRLVVLGPTYLPQPQPIQAKSLIAEPLELNGHQDFALTCSSFLLDFWVRANLGEGAYGVAIQDDEDEILRVALDAEAPRLRITGPEPAAVSLKPPYHAQALHRCTVEVSGQQMWFSIDGADVWTGRLPDKAARVQLFASGAGAVFSQVRLTDGFEDTFERTGQPSEFLGWSVDNNGRPESRAWQVTGGRLHVLAEPQAPVHLVKNLPLDHYEWVINFRLIHGDRLTFYPVWTGADQDLAILLRMGETGWELQMGDAAPLNLPEHFSPREFQQFRFWKQDGWLRLSWLADALGEWPALDGDTSTGLRVEPGTEIELDLARVTRIL